MRHKVMIGLASVLLAALAAGLIILGGNQLAPAVPQETPNARDGVKGDGEEPRDEDKDRKADLEALRKAGQEFVQAFDKGDAKALAAFWTDGGVFHDESGQDLRGRAAIEKAYTDLFKEKPKSKLEIEVQSIHFPSRDTAVEDGVLRLKTTDPELPTSTRYSVLHVRQDGKWKVAIVREWGADEEKLEDVAWLVGNWAAKSKNREVENSYTWNEKKTLIRGRFIVKEGDRVTSSGTQTIGLDPQTGQLRSWIFEEDGGHGQSLWVRDGNRWVLDAAGVLSNGAEYTAVNVVTPINNDEFVWRSVERTLGDANLPDTDPIKLKRVKGDK
jgi:uncharacterized protein (TIGR02246 family)